MPGRWLGTCQNTLTTLIRRSFRLQAGGGRPSSILLLWLGARRQDAVHPQVRRGGRIVVRAGILDLGSGRWPAREVDQSPTASGQRYSALRVTSGSIRVARRAGR